MSEPQTITTDHVRALLAAEDGAAVLALIGGRIETLTPEQIGAEEHRGALEVISRYELADRLGAEPSDEQVATQAGALSASVQQLGG